MFFVDRTQREYSSKPLKHGIAKRILVFKQNLILIYHVSMCYENIINFSVSYIEYILNCCKSEL